MPYTTITSPSVTSLLPAPLTDFIWQLWEETAPGEELTLRLMPTQLGGHSLQAIYITKPQDPDYMAERRLFGFTPQSCNLCVASTHKGFELHLLQHQGYAAS